MLMPFALNQNKYEYKIENIKGGKTYKIKLNSLESDLQEHFNIDDIDLIEKELLEIEPQKVIEVQEPKTTPQPPKIQKIEPKVKTSIVARPIFKNNYERYE